MTLNEYQEAAKTTAVYPAHQSIIYPTIGLAGEAGEVADKVKKVLRDHAGQFDPIANREIIKEIGDVLWYCAILCRDLGYTLEAAAVINIDKLRSRQERGVISGNGDNR